MYNLIVLILALLIQLLTVVVPVLLAVAFLTLVERKVLASFQRRVGPNVVGVLGLLQPFADAAKLLLKEIVITRSANLLLFVLAPIFTFGLSLSSWAVIPFNYSVVFADIDLGLLYIFAISSLNVYAIIIARLVFQF